MLTERAGKILRLLVDPVVCPEGYRIQVRDQDAVREALAEIDRISAEFARARAAFDENNHEIEQVLGRALGYPKFVDDQKNFPGATEEDGVCVGEHVAVTLADEAAKRIKTLYAEVGRLNAAVKRLENS